MAVSLSNNFSLHTSVSASKPSKSKTPQFKALSLRSQRHHHLRQSVARISLSNSPQISSNRRSVRSSVAINSTNHTNDEDEAHLNDVEIPDSKKDQRRFLSLKSLMKAYRKAIIYGDENIISDIEAKMSMVENEKNELHQKVTVLSTEVNSGKEKLIRLQADFDNFRKRSEKEKLTIRSDAQGEVIESLLPMVDNFERAKLQLKLETEQEIKIDTSYQGIYKQFVEIMRSLRVSVVATVGKPFDPAVHEAIAREESHEFKEGIVVQEFRRGFLLGDRLLRPAMVKVSAGPGKQRPATTATNKSMESPAAAIAVE